LDLSPIPSRSKDSEALRNTLDLAQLADGLGYHRYWLAEHHSMIDLGSTAPEIMIGQVARLTKRIRIGSGGILLLCELQKPSVSWRLFSPGGLILVWVEPQVRTKRSNKRSVAEGKLRRNFWERYNS
jgi:hypothetical protein